MSRAGERDQFRAEVQKLPAERSKQKWMRCIIEAEYSLGLIFMGAEWRHRVSVKDKQELEKDAEESWTEEWEDSPEGGAGG